MVEVPQKRVSTTWFELTQTQPEVTENWAAMEKYREEKGIEIH